MILVLVVGVLLLMQSTDFRSIRGEETSPSSPNLSPLLTTLGDLPSHRKGASSIIGLTAGTKLTDWYAKAELDSLVEF